MTVEQRITETLRSNDQYAPSADLFAKVKRSISEDRAHRRRRHRLVAAIAGGIAAATTWVVAWLDIEDGRAEMPWWSVEILTLAVLAILTLGLGPLIRRFGSIYVSDVFRSQPSTGSHFLRVLDVAYYLVFFAFITMTTNFSSQVEWTGLARQLQTEAQRIGGLLLLMGILHAVTIAALTIIGIVFAANQRRAARARLSDDDPPPSPTADTIDRVVTIVVWVATVLLSGWILVTVLLGLIGIGGE